MAHLRAIVKPGKMSGERLLLYAFQVHRIYWTSIISTSSLFQTLRAHLCIHHPNCFIPCVNPSSAPCTLVSLLIPQFPISACWINPLSVWVGM